VQPNSRVIVRLSHLPANYDLALYKDIADAYQSLATPADLARLGAEFAPDSFSPDAFSPDAFSPDAFSPDAFSPDAFSPDSFSPDSFSPDSFSPDSFSPDAFSPDAFSPDAFSPDSFSPDAFSPDSFSPDSFSPDSFSPLDFVSAQTRSLLGVSAFEGIGSEGLIVNTWDNDGDFYVRVRGRNGAFSLAAPFQLQVTLLTGACAAVGPVLPATSLTATARGARTIIVADLARLSGTAADKAALMAALTALAGRVEVAGVVVDVSSDARVVAANAQADTHPSCPHAKNLVAGAIKDVIDRYRAANPLEYIVLVGNDGVIPFFRHPEGALLASERGFVPPVLDRSPSQASLRLGYILSQDRYGAVVDVSRKADRFPVPGLAVGRLVETAADITALIGAYLATSGGVAPAPTSALVTGYDFLADAATAIQQELQAGLGRAPDTLVADRDWSPADPRSWTADQLRAALLGARHDLIFLAGHFSANRALAADYSTRLTAADLVTAPVDLTNSVVWSIGCHAGYNIVDADGVPGVTLEPDWPQAFARKRAVLVAGTGYQYGDTATIEYSERLYVEFARRLRAGQGPVAVGKALVAAKLAYLSATPELRGLHEKSLLQATLYGLPMLAVNLPAGRGDLPPDLSVIGGTTGYARDPGQTLGLRSAEMSLTPALAQQTVSLREPVGGATQLATYLSGSNGAVTNTAEPVLPLELRVVTVPELVVRGVGFRSGRYTDLPDIVPLTGRSTAEIRGVSPPFLSDVFYPVQIARLNYFDRLGRPADGVTRLAVTPAQFRSATPGSNSGTLRRYDELGFRLYYSANMTRYPTSGKAPALAGAPTISGVNARVVGDTVRVAVTVQGDPAAGIQEVWLTYTAGAGPFAGRWQSLDLTQHPADTTRWEGTLPLAATPPNQLRFMVQAVSGVGLVTLASNQGAFYMPTDAAGPVEPTALVFVAPSTSGAYGSQAAFTVQLTASGVPLPNQTVAFAIGAQRRQARTGADGRASAPLALLGLPGPTEVRAAFAGTAALGMAAAATPFTIAGQATTLTLTPADPTVTVGADTGIVAALGDGRGRALGQRSLVVIVTGTNGSYTQALITDHLGRVALGATPLPPGRYTVTAYFGGLAPLSGGAMTVDVAPYAPAQVTTSLTIVALSGTVRGRVFVDGNRSGQPEPPEQLAMATVFLDANGDGRRDPDDPNERATTSATDGTTWNYQFESVAVGTPRVCIELPTSRLLTSGRCQTVMLGASAIVDGVDFGLVTPAAGCSAGGAVHTIAAVAPVGSAAYYAPLDLRRPGTATPWTDSRLLIQATTNNPVVAVRPGERVVNALLLAGVDAAAHPHLALRLQYQRSFQKILRVVAADGTIATPTGGTRLPASPPSGFQYIDVNGTLTIYNVPVVDGVHQDLYVEMEITATAGFITATASIAGTISATGITPLGNTCGDRADTTIFAGTPGVDYGPFPGRAPVDLVPVLPF
ncbi:MAG: hypothetical protein IT340_14515, partial [Chloroflexi bacterium]|nr:hypothetical protein [Chloroflexota bacterium]